MEPMELLQGVRDTVNDIQAAVNEPEAEMQAQGVYTALITALGRHDTAEREQGRPLRSAAVLWALAIFFLRATTKALDTSEVPEELRPLAPGLVASVLLAAATASADDKQPPTQH